MPPENLKNEFEKALAELRELCDESIDLDERKHRLAIRKEMNRLYRLYEKYIEEESTLESGNETSELLLEIRGHLEPLGLAPVGAPLAELARLAALALTQK